MNDRPQYRGADGVQVRKGMPVLRPSTFWRDRRRRARAAVLHGVCVVVAWSSCAAVVGVFAVTVFGVPSW